MPKKPPQGMIKLPTKRLDQYFAAIFFEIPHNIANMKKNVFLIHKKIVLCNY